MNWNSDVSERARETLKNLGWFSPTVHAELAEVKGSGYWGDDEPGKVYLTAKDLREMSVDLIEVADWLERRAKTTPEDPHHGT